jgi:hypothetical protein
MRAFNLFSYLSLIQGAYYLITGIWPLVDIRTFQKVTGPKTDLWLVKTVGVLVSVIGAVLTVAGLHRQTTIEMPMLGIGSAAALTVVDIIYVTRKRISRIYLLDAAAELILIALWAFIRRRGRATNLLGEIFGAEDDRSPRRGIAQ